MALVAVLTIKPVEREPEDEKRKVDRVWRFIETSDIETAKASARIREHLRSAGAPS